MKALRIIAVLILMLPILAHAQLRLELGATRVNFSEREDGTWYQTRFETHNSLVDHGFMLGLSGDIGKAIGLSWRWTAAWNDLGRAKANNIATVHDDDVSAPVLTCDPATAKGCLARYQGSGGAYGGSFGATAEKRFGDFSFGVGAGVFIYRSWWDETVTHFEDCAWGTCGMPVTYNHAGGTHRTPYVEILARYKWLFASARQYRDVYGQGQDQGGDVGLFGKRARQLTAGFSIPF